MVTAPPHQETDLQTVFARQQAHQYTVARTTARERKAKLRRLHDALLEHREAIQAAMRADFGKSEVETDLTEIGVVAGEIRHTVSRLSRWMRPRRVGTPLVLFGTRSEIRYEPKGVCLILAPWNFPFNLTLGPLVQAIGAGNCVILKPSEFTPHSTAVMRRIIGAVFPPEEVALVEGDAAVAQALLCLPFNHVFFTGSPAVGKLVMKAAAEHLTSVTLELGGKSPVIVDATADLDNAAAKIAWVKGINAGQICIAPDYVLVDASVHDAFVEKLESRFAEFYGATAAARRASPDYARIVNHRHFDRVRALLDDAAQRGATIRGGAADRATRFLEPTILTGVPDEAAIWQEEIFGPLVPVRPFRTLDEATAYIQQGPAPLALYIFTARRATVDTVLADTRNGGVTVNDCGLHFYNVELPFGGVGNSGMGKSHGRYGFEQFSNARGVVYQNRILPLTNFFLPPYRSKLLNWVREGVVKWF
jgi:aldehyde dehydrogenase (NAD+)